MSISNLASKSAAVSGVLVVAGLAMVASPSASKAGMDDPFGALPSSIQLTGVVRDFKERSVAGGHPDFERQPSGGFGSYMKIV